MTQYVMFQSTPEIEAAIKHEDIHYLTPNKVYVINDKFIIDDAGNEVCVMTTKRSYKCALLNFLAQWQYCDADGNIL